MGRCCSSPKVLRLVVLSKRRITVGFLKNCLTAALKSQSSCRAKSWLVLKLSIITIGLKTSWITEARTVQRRGFVYDGYRSHLSLNALKTLSDGKVLAYYLPAHKRCTTQLLDRGGLCPFKRASSMAVDEAASTMSFPDFDIFDLLRLMTQTCDAALDKTVVRSA